MRCILLTTVSLILFMYFLTLPSLLHPSIIFYCPLVNSCLSTLATWHMVCPLNAGLFCQTVSVFVHQYLVVIFYKCVTSSMFRRNFEDYRSCIILCIRVADIMHSYTTISIKTWGWPKYTHTILIFDFRLQDHKQLLDDSRVHGNPQVCLHMFNMLTRHIQPPQIVDTCVEETCICCAIKLLLFNDCSSCIYNDTCIYKLDFMKVMASAKHYVVITMLKVFQQ